MILKGMEEKSTDAETVHLLQEVISSSVNGIAQNLLKQQPLLLPQVYKNYCTTFHEAASSRTMSCSLVVAPESVESTRYMYLLSYLVTPVGKYLKYTMKQRSAGTHLHRRGTDPLLMLTKVFHRKHSGFYHHHQAPKNERDESNHNHMHYCH